MGFLLTILGKNCIRVRFGDGSSLGNQEFWAMLSFRCLVDMQEEILKFFNFRIKRGIYKGKNKPPRFRE